MTIGIPNKKQKIIEKTDDLTEGTKVAAVARGQIPPAESSFAQPINSVSSLSLLGKRRRDTTKFGENHLKVFWESLKNKNIEHATEIALSSEIILDERTESGGSALHFAAAFGQAALMQILVEKAVKNGKNIDKDFLNTKEETPLHSACRARSAECVKILLKGGADWNLEDENGDTPLCLTVGATGCFDITKEIASYALSQERPIEMESIFGMIGRLSYLEKQHLKRIIPFEELSRKGLLRGADDWSELHYAAAFGPASVLQSLVDDAVKNGKNIDKDFLNEKEETPLHIACKWNSTECVKILLKSGADWDLEDDNADTPFNDAVRDLSFDAIKEIAVYARAQKRTINIESSFLEISKYYSPEDKQKLQQVIPFEQLNAVKIIGHAWGLNGPISFDCLADEYEGSFPRFMEPTVYAYFKKYLEQLEPQHKLKGLLNEIDEIAKSSSLKDPADLQDPIEDGKIRLIYVGTKGHAQYLVVSSSNLYQCNRGLGSTSNDEDTVLGVISYKMGSKENLAELLTELSYYNDSGTEYATFDIKNFVPVDVDDKREYIFKKQSNENCSLASLKAALFALMMEYSISLGMKEEEAEALVRNCYKGFSRFHRIQMMESFLARPYFNSQIKVLIDVLKKLEDDTQMTGIFHGHELERKRLTEKIRNIVEKIIEDARRRIAEREALAQKNGPAESKSSS